jgi:hypothetical protein
MESKPDLVGNPSSGGLARLHKKLSTMNGRQKPLRLCELNPPKLKNANHMFLFAIPR